MEHTPDLAKLRRFALVVGLLLFLYALGLVELAEPGKSVIIKLSNLPQLKINPKLIGMGLLIVSIYAWLRYWYYAIWATFSPMYERSLIRKGKMPPSLSEKAAETVRLKIEAPQLSFPYETKSLQNINAMVNAIREGAWKLNNDAISVVQRLFPKRGILEMNRGDDDFGMLVPYDETHQKQLLKPLDQPLGNSILLTLRFRGLVLAKKTDPVILWHNLDYTLPLWVNGIAIATYLLTGVPWESIPI